MILYHRPPNRTRMKNKKLIITGRPSIIIRILSSFVFIVVAIVTLIDYRKNQLTSGIGSVQFFQGGRRKRIIKQIVSISCSSFPPSLLDGSIKKRKKLKKRRRILFLFIFIAKVQR